MWLGRLKRHPLLGRLRMEQREPDPASCLVGNSGPGTNAAPWNGEDSIGRP